MRKIKRNILLGAIGIICCVAGIAIWSIERNNSHLNKSYEVTPIAMSYAFDPNDIEYYMRDADYVFSGDIKKLAGTDYRHKDIVNGREDTGIPYTKLEVEITKAYKGDVSKGDTIKFMKLGGVTEDGKYYYLCEDDVIPEEGKEYTFLGYVQESGELIATGKNSTIEKNNIKLTQKLEKVLPAVEKKGNTKGERYTLDEKYKDEK